MPGPGQRPHPQPDDPDARRRRRPAADALAAGAHLADRGRGDRPGIRRRRRRAGDRRDAARRHHLLQRELLLPRRAGRDLPPPGLPRRGRPAGDRFPDRLGGNRDEYFDKAPAKSTTTARRRPAGRHRVSRRMRRTRSTTPASSASACWPTSSTCRCTCTCTRPRRKSRSRCKQHGQRPLARLDRLGLVNDRLIAVHMTQLTDAEIALCAERGVVGGALPGVQPQARLGFLPGRALHARRRQPGPRHRRLRQQQRPRHVRRDAHRRAAGQGRGRRRRGPRRARARCDARRWAAPRRMGLDDRIGSIEPGKQADLALRRRSTRWKPSRCTTRSRSWSMPPAATRSAMSGSPASASSPTASWSTWTSVAHRAPGRGSGSNASRRSERRHERARRTTSARPNSTSSANSPTAGGTRRVRSGRCMNSIRRGWATSPSASPLRGARGARCRLRRRPAERGAGAARREGRPRIDLAPELLEVAQAAPARIGPHGRLPPAVGRSAGAWNARRRSTRSPAWKCSNTCPIRPR